MSAIESSVNWVDVSVLVEITSLLGVRLGGDLGTESVRFDVSAKLEEKERRSGRVVISFGLAVRTKPSVVKYEVDGTATLTGKDALIDKVLEVDPESKIPFVFHRVYQHVFTAIYMLASLIGAIYPPPDLLFSGKQGVPVKSLKRVEQTEVAKVTETAEAVEAVEAAEVAEVAQTTEPTESVEPARPVEPMEAIEPAVPAEPAVSREENTAQQTEASAT